MEVMTSSFANFDKIAKEERLKNFGWNINLIFSNKN